MRKLLAIGTLVLCFATFTNHPQKRYHDSSKIFWDYMRTFEREYSRFDVNLQNTRIVLGMPHFDYNIMGYCHPDGTIELSTIMWKTLTPPGRELLVFHELGHCVLGLDHTRELLGALLQHSPDYCPSSLMHIEQDQFHAKCYEAFKTYYRDSLKILKLTKMRHGE